VIEGEAWGKDMGSLRKIAKISQLKEYAHLLHKPQNE
jgi:hypothetical protein